MHQMIVKPSPRLTHLGLLLPILLLSFGLRLYQLDEQSLRGDEAATVLYSAMPITELWELARITDPHPPLFYALLHPWQALLGEQVWPMRFFGVMSSTLAVATLCGLVQRTLRNVRLTVLSGFLLAINPLQIWLAQDLRSYSLFTLIGLLSSTALWIALADRQTSPKKFITYTLLTVACLYTHYYAVFLIAFQGLFVLINMRRFWPQRYGWLGSQLAIAGLITPGLMLAYNFIGQAAGGIETLSTPTILRLASTALLTGFTIDAHSGIALSLVITPIWLIGLRTILRQNQMVGSFWGLFFVLPVMGVIGLSIDRPFFKERFLVQAQPALCLLIAVGLRQLSTWRIPKPKIMASIGWLMAIIVTLHICYTNSVSLMNYFAEPTYRKAKPWRLYHEYVNRHAQPDDVMLTNFPEASVSYYSPNHLPFYVVPEERDRSQAYRVERTAQIGAAYQRIWMLPLLHQGFDEQGDVLKWLDRHADRVHQIFFREYNLNLYLTPKAIEQVMIPQPAQFAHGVKLRGFQIFNEQGDSRLKVDGEQRRWLLAAEAEESLTLSLYWQADEPTERPYTVFVHVVAADGFNRVGQDNQPVWNSYPTTNWQPNDHVTDKYTLTIPAGTPSAPHQIRVGWYGTENGERVSVIKADGVSDDAITLDLTVQIQ